MTHLPVSGVKAVVSKGTTGFSKSFRAGVAIDFFRSCIQFCTSLNINDTTNNKINTKDVQ